MADAPFRTGWVIVRARYPELVSVEVRRRRTIIAGSVATAVGTAASLTEIVWHWATTPAPLVVVGLVLIAAAFGSGAAASHRLSLASPPLWAFIPSGNWRRQERIARQFAPRPPAMAPEDRDLVIAAAERARDGLVLSAARTLWLPAAWALVWLGVAAVGLEGRFAFSLFTPLGLGLLQSSTFIAAVTGLGRMELARRRAEALPPLPEVAPPRRPTGRGPSGSKLSLPGE
ncbi:hypothetical protein DEI81_15580 [Curtobacterium sp. MCBD17_013]|uniref:hypothetical protein n=1 Tax=unclassified Curtobacterium TaxID=257496 RepID=UPI000DAABC38|nr:MULTISPECIES: hypothetical protein [unclassified Curtobacterium]PZF57220.1 hypothetical protein DEI81_15580 [Curtobacterium sp. MCBD17_013]WIB67307.1 hypothetical protein DEI93_15335 [Curtobacterium sp. MCBD17_035]